LIEKSDYADALKKELTSKFESNFEWEKNYNQNFLNNRLFQKIKKILGYPAPVFYPRLHY
jgi:hypothetical protein